MSSSPQFNHLRDSFAQKRANWNENIQIWDFQIDVWSAREFYGRWCFQRNDHAVEIRQKYRKIGEKINYSKRAILY